VMGCPATGRAVLVALCAVRDCKGPARARPLCFDRLIEGRF